MAASGILETFGIVFDSDASEVTAGAAQAEAATDSLGDAIEDVDNSTAGLGDSFLDLIGSAQGALLSILGAGALTAGIINAAQMTDEIGKFSETLDLNVDDVHAWSEAVVRSGGDAGGFQSSVKSLTERLADFSLTGGGPAAEVFKKLGINAKDANGNIKEAFDILPELAEVFQDLSKSESAGLGQRLGLDQGTILLLQQGKTAVEDLVDRQKQLGVVTQEDYLIAAKFNDQWADIKQVFQSIFVTAGTTILPVFTDLLSYAETAIFFLKDNQNIIEGFFIGIAGVITATYGPAIAAAAAATITAAAPFVAIGAAVLGAGIAFALIYDDIKNFIEGNKSLIGQIIKDYPIIGKIIDALVESVKAHIQVVGNLVGFIGDVFTEPKKAILELWGLMKEFFAFLESKLPSLNIEVPSGLSNLLGFGEGANVRAAGRAFNTIDSNPLNGATSNSIINSKREVNRSTSVNVGEVNVNTQATDAEGIAEGAATALSSEMQKLANDSDDGVDM